MIGAPRPMRGVMRLPFLLLLATANATSHPISDQKAGGAEEPSLRPAGAEAAARASTAVPHGDPTVRAPLPEGFVVVTDVVPTVVVDLRYATARNFVGTPIAGYEANRAILTRPAALALRSVQADLARQGLGLKIFDAYRPQRAVVHFLRWAQDPAESPQRPLYHPRLNKRQIFAGGYLALDSAHTRGSAVDVTLVRRRSAGGWQELDLGTPFDFFGPEATFAAPGLSPAQQANRQTLRDAMTRHGFEPYDREWWHFQLRDEPYPETAYDFPVR